MNEHLLEISDLKTHFYTEKGRVTAVDGLTLNVEQGEILGIVGESGCGKSVTVQSILRLLEERSVEYEGEVNFKGNNLLAMKQSGLQKIRGDDISMIFQDPMSSLNPVYSIGNQIIETILLHQNVSKKEAHKLAIEILRKVGMPEPERRLDEFPHQLSGGMRQRILIAIALVCRPDLLIADEPTTALDVTIQAQILDLIVQMNKDMGMGIIFITHDLGVISEICSRVAVMYLGQIVEVADVNELFERPLHPYTKGLMKSIPQLDGDRSEKLYTIKGRVPSLDKVPQGCRFAPRCPFADDLCREKMPELRKDNEGHTVRCWHYEEILEKREDSNHVTNVE